GQTRAESGADLTLITKGSFDLEADQTPLYPPTVNLPNDWHGIGIAIFKPPNCLWVVGRKGQHFWWRVDTACQVNNILKRLSLDRDSGRLQSTVNKPEATIVSRKVICKYWRIDQVLDNPCWHPPLRLRRKGRVSVERRICTRAMFWIPCHFEYGIYAFL